MEEAKVFNDPVHGHIEMHPLCVKIIDTPQFQRLRYIKQLGATYFVYPGASHNRFEHSLGVGYLAGELVRHLRSKDLKEDNKLNITDEDILCVEIAGLCHDLGHGPFSHVFDAVFIPKVNGNKDWRHEQASVKMFEYLVEVNNLHKEFEKWKLNAEDRIFITEQIAGPSAEKVEGCWPFKGRTREKSFLYEVVANKRNGIDVDKWDYFARDCHHLGIRSNFDHSRFMKFTRVLKVDGQLQICSRDKEVSNCYDMFYTRNVLHRRAYQHKNTKIVECMITDAMLLANDHLLFANKEGNLLKLSETINDMSAYIKLNDGIFHTILYSTDEKLKEAREILERVECRKLYKFIGQTPVQPGTPKFTEDEMTEKIASISREISSASPLDLSDVIVQIVRYDYGMRKDNPVDHIRFYKKSDPTKPMPITQQQVSQMLPQNFSEEHIRVYFKKREAKSVALATKCFRRFCDANNMLPPKGDDPGSVDMTPNKTNLEVKPSLPLD